MNSDFEALSELLFPNITKTPEYYEDKYPPRNLPEGAHVSRFAPSPTGFLHFGGLYAASASKADCEKTGGVFFLRIEDTDKKREVKGGVDGIIKSLKYFNVSPDEGVTGENEERGDYGPYTQSKRKEIYQAFAKDLVKRGLAYPCFCSEDELNAIRDAQKDESVKGYWGKWAKCRNLSFDEIKSKISAGEPWTLRFKSPGKPENKITFNDLIKGKIEMSENVIDVVLLKTDGIPTYHFAHVIDDHLMRTTHVIRGDEWISSVPLHLQLFRALNFKPVKYAHIAPILKEEDGGKRKLSKRKDPEASVSYYIEQGYPAESVKEYIYTILNSNFEDWRRANKTSSLSSFPFSLKKMSVSGALFDLVKLNDVSKNVISIMSAEDVYLQSLDWAKKYNRNLADLYLKDEGKAKAILNIDREKKKPRKDIAKWSDIPDYISYMYSETYVPCYELSGNADAALAKQVLPEYAEVFSTDDDKDTWFSKIKQLSTEIPDSTDNVKEFKKNPGKFKYHVGDVSTVIRVALTGRTNTPDLYEIIKILGADEVKRRLYNALDYYGGK